MLMLLLKNVFRTLFAHFRQGRLLKKKRVLFTLLGLALLPVLIITQTVDMFRVWLQIPSLGEDFLLRFVSTSFFGLFCLLFLAGQPGIMFHFFLAPDLALLKTLPIDKKIIYSQKFVETATGNLGLYVAIGLPLLFSMSLALDASPFVYLFIVLVSFLFIVIPTGFAGIFVFILAHLFSIKKMRRVSTLLLGLFIILTWAGFQFLRVSRLNPLASEFEPGAISSFTHSTKFLDGLILPSDWVVRVIHAAISQQWHSLLLYFGLLFLVAALLVWFVIIWRVKLEGKDFRIDAAARLKTVPAGAKVKSRIIRLAFAQFQKESRLMFRDTRFLQSYLLLTTMIALVPFVTSVAPVAAEETMGFFTPYMPLTILALIASSALTRQGMAMERLSFPYVLLSPIAFKSLLIYKVLHKVIMLLPFVLVSVFIIAFKAGTPPIFVLMHVSSHVCFLLCGAMLGQAVAVATTHFNWVDPRYMMNPTGVFMAPLLTLVCGGIGLAIFAVGIELGQQIVAFLLFFIYVAFVFWTSQRAATARLIKLEWIY